MKRSYCSVCHFPESTCICEHVVVCTNAIKVVVLQHPKEAQHAKNTVALLKLALSDFEIITGETAEDFLDIRKELQSRNPVIVYPGTDAIKLPKERLSFTPDTLVLIDGTWKKAYKMIKLNPWLMTLPCVSFSDEYQNSYSIRKSPNKQSLSTLEAVYLSLSHIEGNKFTPLLDLFHHFMDLRQSFVKNS
mgnify:CR=1 FL=1